MAEYSRYNIFSKIRDSENYFILNLLTGNADILSPDEARKLDSYRNGGISSDPAFVSELTSKGYISEENEERRLFNSRYLDFIDSRNKDEIQIFFVTNYSCNFACSYCYQDQYNNQHTELTEELMDAFFAYVRGEFAGRRKYLTLFGGEPLLNSAKQKKLISRFIDQAAASDLEVSIVTNGFYLEEYIDILSKGRIREIQVTLDGTEKVHDMRRFLKGGGGTFNKIVAGIDASLSRGIDINLRMVIDRDNISALPDLAAYAIERGWTRIPLFKTQIGRNYELHHCQSSPGKLFDRISLFEQIYELIKQYPFITEFYKPAYSVSKFLAENGELPDPLFDACPACTTEWAFDYMGNIYSCTATVGKRDESLGTFYPSVTRKDEMISQWEERDITTIAGCRDCQVQLACGGGCGSVAKNRYGSLFSPDCRPVRELLELGFSAYIKNQ